MPRQQLPTRTMKLIDQILNANSLGGPTARSLGIQEGTRRDTSRHYERFRVFDSKGAVFMVSTVIEQHLGAGVQR